MCGRGKRSLRPCDDRHSSSKKDVKLSHSSLVIKGECGRSQCGRSQCRQQGDGEGRAATSSLFVWGEPPSLAHTPPNPHIAVLYGFRCYTGVFVQLLLHISLPISCLLRICSSNGSSCRDETTLLRLLWNTLPTGSDGAHLSCVSSWCLDGGRYQKELLLWPGPPIFKVIFSLLHLPLVFPKFAMSSYCLLVWSCFWGC